MLRITVFLVCPLFYIQDDLLFHKIGPKKRLNYARIEPFVISNVDQIRSLLDRRQIRPPKIGHPTR